LNPDKLSEAAITYSAHSCPKCRGFWVSDAQLQQIETEEKARLIEFRRIPSPEAQAVPLNCPGCGKPMEKHTSTRDAKVIIDACGTCHQVWLDGGEIDAIQTESLVALVGGLFRALKAARAP
jgi:Zn-finger nucleic acid-binding protein